MSYCEYCSQSKHRVENVLQIKVFCTTGITDQSYCYVNRNDRFDNNKKGCARFAEILSELTKTWSSGATEFRVRIGNCKVKV